MYIHTRPASIMSIKLHSSLIPYELIAFSNYGRRLKKLVLKETPTGYSNWHTPWLGLNNIDATSYPTDQTTIFANHPRGFVEIEVTSAVKGWKSCSPNYGVVIWATNENIAGRDTRFASNADSDSSRHAYIILNCNNDDTTTITSTTAPTTSSTTTGGGRSVTLLPPRTR